MKNKTELHKHDEYFKADFLYDALSKNEDFQTAADIFSLLSDMNRLKIFWLLCHSKECVINIAGILKITTPSVSHHLKLLKEYGLIESYRDGKEVFYAAAGTKESRTLHSIIEKLMSVSCPDFYNEHEKINENSEYLEDHISKIKKIHDFLTENLSRRIKIEELSKQFAMNSSTMKTVFKDVYGNAIATHIKEHRMNKAAELLASTDLPISEIALMTGYRNQSKFCAVFKDFFRKTPLEYRKQKKV